MNEHSLDSSNNKISTSSGTSNHNDDDEKRKGVKSIISESGIINHGPCSSMKCNYGSICVEITKQVEPTRIMIPECICPESCEHYLGLPSFPSATSPLVGEKVLVGSPGQSSFLLSSAVSFDFGSTVLLSRSKRMINRTTTTPSSLSISEGGGSNLSGQGFSGIGTGSNNTDPVSGVSGSEFVICGSNGKDYLNECEMRKSSCHLQRSITVKYQGKCGECALSSFTLSSLLSDSNTLKNSSLKSQCLRSDSKFDSQTLSIFLKPSSPKRMHFETFSSQGKYGLGKFFSL